MKLQFSILLVLIWALLGCRAKSEVQVSRSRNSTEEIGVELRKADSLWSFLAEHHHVKIEFYPPYSLGNHETPTTDDSRNGTSFAFTGSSSPAASFGLAVDNVGCTLPQGVVGSLGAVKSIEIDSDKTEERAASRATDSVSEQKSNTSETLQRERASEARQDNGTVAILAIVGAAAFLAFVVIMIKHFWK